MSRNGPMTRRAVRMVSQGKSPAFVLTCPQCGEKEVTITLALDDLATCRCSSCDDEFAVSTAVKMLTDRLAAWVKVQLWIDLAAEILDDVQDAPAATDD